MSLVSSEMGSGQVLLILLTGSSILLYKPMVVVSMRAVEKAPFAAMV